MLWADTTAGIMKMRNGANSAWISLWELDGTFIASDISLSAGTAGAPSLYFTGDTNTGLFSPGADTVALATAGSNRLHITSAGLVGIGTSAPGALLNLQGTFGTSLTTGLRIDGLGSTTNNLSPIAFYIQSSNWGTQHAANIACGTLTGLDGGGYLRFSTSPDGNTAPAERVRITATGNVGIGTQTPGYPLDVNGRISYNGAIGEGSSTTLSSTSTTIVLADSATWQQVAIKTAGTERARIDSSGRLLVGTSSARAAGGHTGRFQLEGTNYEEATASIAYNANDANGGYLHFIKTRSGNTVVQSGDLLGHIRFYGTDGSAPVAGVSIKAEVDGTPGANDMPGRLVFSTTTDGASSPTERFRIGSAGQLGIGGATYGTSGQVLTSGGASAAPSWTTVGSAAGTLQAWVNFNGTGTVAIRASGNVSSITDNGTGDYTVNFTTALADANYAAIGTAGSGSSASKATIEVPTATPTTSAVRLVASNYLGTITDYAYVSVAIFR
jgi:hypothetical protein